MPISVALLFTSIVQAAETAGLDTDLAVIVVVHVLNAWTAPVDETVATTLLLLVQINEGFEAFAGLTVAVKVFEDGQKCTVCLRPTIFL